MEIRDHKTRYRVTQSGARLLEFGHLEDALNRCDMLSPYRSVMVELTNDWGVHYSLICGRGALAVRPAIMVAAA